MLLSFLITLPGLPNARKNVNRDDDWHAKLAGVLNVTLHIAQAVLQQLEVLPGTAARQVRM